LFELKNTAHLNRKNVTQTLVLLLLLAGLPLGSWYYLNKGYNYRKTRMDQLQNLSSLPAVELPDHRDSLIRLDDFRGKALVLADIEATDAAALEALRNIGDQFAESGAVSIAVLAPDADATAMQAPFQAATQERPGLFHVLKNGSEQAAQLRKNMSLSGTANVALADTSLMVRQVYDLSNAQDIRRLVDHLVIVIPSKRSPKPVLKRPTEK